MVDHADVPSDLWTSAEADRYDDPDDAMFAPELLTSTTAFLADLAGDGPALEFAIGTGRVAIALYERGVPVTGIEFSEPMANVLRRKNSEIPVTIGDMATTQVDGEFSLVYLVFNTIGNLYTQDAQVACFGNAARHLRPGGCFVVEVNVPPWRSLPPNSLGVVSDITGTHAGIDTFDTLTQRAVTHHYTQTSNGTYRYAQHNYRAAWPSELDLMARLAGMNLEGRFADWTRAPFTAESASHVSVWRKST